MQFFMGYQDDNKIVRDKWIAKKYAVGWAPIDFISSCPLEMFLPSSTSGTTVVTETRPVNVASEVARQQCR